MKILIHINEIFQIIRLVEPKLKSHTHGFIATSVHVVEKVSSQITTVISELMRQTIATRQEFSAQKILAKTKQEFAFLDITTQLVEVESSNQNIIAVHIELSENNVVNNANQFFKENIHFKPLVAETEDDLWRFLENAEINESEDVDWRHHHRKINERLELLLREAEKQGLEWIKTMSDLTVSMAKLKESEQTKKALLEAVPDAMFQINKEGFFLEYIPAKGESVIPAAAFIENNMKDILPEEYAQEAMEVLEYSLENAKVEAYSFEWELEEGLRYYEMRFSPINQSEALCMMRDITEEKRGEELLRKSVMYYQDLIKRSPAPMMALDKEGRFVDINAAAMDLFGVVHHKQLQNLRGFDFIHKDQRSLVKDRLKRGFKDNFPLGTATYKIVRLDGREIDVEVAAAIMVLGGKRVAQAILREVK